MIAVTMCDDGGLHRLPGVYVEVSGRTIKPVRGDDDERFGGGNHDYRELSRCVFREAAGVATMCKFGADD
jgi:hypothetical protein